jgi:hypothetical protein
MCNRCEKFEDKWHSSLNTKFDRVNKKWVFDGEKAKKSFEGTKYDDNGVLRWQSNDRIPPSESLCSFAKAGLIEWKYAKGIEKILEIENQQFLLKLYKSIPKEFEAEPEILNEARANFDEDTEVVYLNPFTQMNLKTGKCKRI